MYTYSIHINILYRIHSVYVQVSNRKPAFVTGTQTNLYRHLYVMQHPRLQLLKWHQRSFKTKLANKNSSKKNNNIHITAKRYKHTILPPPAFSVPTCLHVALHWGCRSWSHTRARGLERGGQGVKKNWVGVHWWIHVRLHVCIYVCTHMSCVCVIVYLYKSESTRVFLTISLCIKF